MVRLGRYQVLEQIGAGGMARVYRARDPRLARELALKVLTDASDEKAERLLNEARTQASLSHENVCKVYEVGVEEGLPYIAMQLVRGRTLLDEAARLSLTEKVRAMKSVAEALHAAHRAGLIHRDVKPSNILLSRAEDGTWKPYVTDFGLARDEVSPRLTRTGCAVGTPSYMAPEQVRAEDEALTRRTDIWGLGATLYELLADEPPFEGASGAETMANILGEEARPLRRVRPELPADLETIVARCLEKDPARRYESARALAEDLARFLDGEPILARRAGPVSRSIRRLRKNRPLAVALASLAVAVLLLLAQATRMRWILRERDELARRLGADVKEMEQLMRLSALQPLHDTGREAALVRRRMDELRALGERMGPAGEGPVRYALGRGHLALLEPERARRELEAAVRAGFAAPEVHLALGQALGSLYQKALEELPRLPTRDLREKRKRRLTSELKLPALSHLRQAEGVSLDSPHLVKGLIAYHEERFAEARGYALRALEEAPWLHEARRLLGDVSLAEGTSRRLAGDYAGALALYADAGAAYREGLDLARSDVALYEGEARRRILELEVLVRQGRYDEGSFFEALDACRRSRRAAPGRARPLFLESQLWARRGEWQWGHGREAEESLDCAASLAEEGLGLEPSDLYAHLLRGMAYALLGEVARWRGGDPRPVLSRAVTSLGEALELSPEQAAAQNNLGNVLKAAGEWELGNGLDPTTSLGLALERYRLAASAAPEVTSPHNNAGVAFLDLARFRLERGEDPEPQLERARASLARALSLDERNAYAHVNLCEEALLDARRLERLGRPPEPALDRSLSHAERAIALNPSFAEVHVRKAQALTRRAERRLLERDRRGALEALRAALAAARRAREINPKDPEAAATMRQVEARLSGLGA